MLKHVHGMCFMLPDLAPCLIEGDISVKDSVGQALQWQLTLSRWLLQACIMNLGTYAHLGMHGDMLHL